MKPFPNTHWSLVRRAGLPDINARREALTVLLSRYEAALRSYIRAIWCMADDQAEDLLQAFIADQILERELCRQADEKRGRFRALLLTSLRNFATSRYRSQLRRTTVALPENAVTDSGPTSAIVVEAAWARALVTGVIDAMRNECGKLGRQDIWIVFEERLLAEIFGKGQTTPYEELATRLKLTSPTQATNLLVTGKRMYARLLRAAVAEYEYDAVDVDEEIEELRRVLKHAAVSHPD